MDVSFTANLSWPDRSRRAFTAWALLAGIVASTAAAATGYRKQVLSDQFFCEGATFGDLNRDGVQDAIAGPYWYAGPDFSQRRELYPAAPYDPKRYSENFVVFTHDFNGDGWLDVLVLGFPGVDASWYENPGDRSLPWMRHVVFLPVDNESPTFGDLLGNGRPVLICTSGGRVGYATWNPADPKRPWVFRAVSEPGPWQRFTHGLGFGDIDGDGRADLIDKDGWWQQPAVLEGNPLWKRHLQRFSSPAGGAQILVTDISGDGLPDVVSSKAAHGYGLSWYEQKRDPSGVISFFEHVILSENADEKRGGVQFSQLHALALADVDGDSLLDLVTGKRWWGHGPKNDPEPNAAAVIYAFLQRRETSGSVHFTPHLIDDNSGVGVQVVAQDINSDGRADIIAANKRGTFVFVSEPVLR